jgi:gas vesicle protein
MNKANNCKHDFLAILHCKKCGEQFHVNWPDAVKQAKLDAVAEVLQRLKSTIVMKASDKNRKEVTDIALKALKEVREVYEKAKREDKRKATDIALNAIEDTERDYKGTIS